MMLLHPLLLSCFSWMTAVMQLWYQQPIQQSPACLQVKAQAPTKLRTVHSLQVVRPQDGLTCGTCVSLTSQLLADRGATEKLYCQHALQGVLPRLRRAVDMNDGSCSSCYTNVT